MALKDLVADRSMVTEETIENIITDYVRYDPNTYELVLTPGGVALGNDAKVLVILVALMGWKYVVDEVPKIDTKPATLEVLTGIPGGTLRPILKKLKDIHLLAVADGSYSVRVTNLDAIARTVGGEKAISPQKLRSRKGEALRKNAAAETTRGQKANDGAEALVSSGRRRASLPVRASLVRLLDSGFFSETRTLGQVISRLHEMAINVKGTSLSGPMAELVREGKLERKKVMQGAKKLWSYGAA